MRSAQCVGTISSFSLSLACSFLGALERTFALCLIRRRKLQFDESICICPQSHFNAQSWRLLFGDFMLTAAIGARLVSHFPMLLGQWSQ